MLQSKQRLLELNAKLAETLTDKGVTATADETTTALIDKVKNISGADKLVEFSQVRPEVQSYLDNVTYDSSDYTSSQISDYVTDTSNNQPVGCKVSLKSAGTLIVYDSASGGSLITNSVAGNNYIYNLTPNAVCHYVNILNGNIEQSGTIKATGKMRMIKSASAYNIRDLGGWSCDGGMVKYGKLFRGSQIWATDKPTLVKMLGVTDDLDLRWDSEVTNTSSVLGLSVNYKHINGAWYGGQYVSNLKDEFAYAINCVNSGRVLYFHCAGGADRTGTLSMIIEAVLGVSQSDIDKDYELTCFNTGVSTDTASRRRNESEWTGLINYFADYSGETLRDRVVNYLVGAGIGISEINAFRRNVIDGSPADLVSDIVAITNSLTNATTSNTAVSVDLGGAYTATITAADGYKLDGATVTVTMGGEDITSSAYSDGVINISNVTGDIVITVIAKKSTATNVLTTAFTHNGASYSAIGYEDGMRLSVSSGTTKAAESRVTIGYCPISKSDIVRIKGLTYATSSDGTVAIARYDSGKTFISANNLYTGNTTPLNGLSCTFDNDNAMLTIKIGDISNGLLRLTGIGTTGADCVVTINEDIT